MAAPVCIPTSSTWRFLFLHILTHTCYLSFEISVDTVAIKIRVNLTSFSLNREDMDTKNSTLLIRPIKEVDTGDLQELKKENPRRKKKKAARRLPLQEMESPDSDDSSHGNMSRESYPERHPKPKVGGEQHHFFLEHAETSLKDSVHEITPPFPGQFKPQYSKTSPPLK